MTDEPVSWLVIEPGWVVVAADGTEVGRVEELIGDTGKDIFNGLAISSGVLGKAKYVPSERVSAITDGRVQLDLEADAVDALGDHEQPPPSEQLRPS